MKPIDPAELSAYLDGELGAPRAKEVENSLALDPALRMQYEHLKRMDAQWAAAARQAISRPTLRLGPHKPFARLDLTVAAATLLLLALRILPKLSDTIVWGVVLHSMTLIVLLVWILRMAGSDTAEEATLSAP